MQRLDMVARVMRNWPFDATCLRRSLVAGQRLRRLQPELNVGVAMAVTASHRARVADDRRRPASIRESRPATASCARWASDRVSELEAVRALRVADRFGAAARPTESSHWVRARRPADLVITRRIGPRRFVRASRRRGDQRDGVARRLGLRDSSPGLWRATSRGTPGWECSFSRLGSTRPCSTRSARIVCRLRRIIAAAGLLAFKLQVAGETVLHASAVQFGDSAVAFVGYSGMGKSTMATLCCAEGALLVTDDLLRVDLSGDSARCYRGGGELRLRPNAAGLVDRFAARPESRTTSMSGRPLPLRRVDGRGRSAWRDRRPAAGSGAGRTPRCRSSTRSMRC